MRVYLLFIISFTLTNCFSQETISSSIYDSGKNEFKLQVQKDTPDYSVAFKILTKQVKENPKNAEYRYFLGYTIDRLNADDGKSMNHLKKEKSIKASEQFEEVNKLEPIYNEELFLLDPYSKITSIWGCLAESYLNRGLIDSAIWSFQEGKKRGGFIEPLLEYNRQLLNSCQQNSILFTYGDNITIPIWYLQFVENYRTDVTAIDANLIKSTWYPKYLKKTKKVKISLTDSIIENIEYQNWQTKTINVINSKDTSQRFGWELKPTYMDNYILRGDLIMLDIIKQNIYERKIYFTSGSDSTYNLFLSPYLTDEGLVDRVIPKEIDWASNILTIPSNIYHYNIDHLKKEDIIKSQDAILLLNNFRWSYINSVNNLIENSENDKARDLIRIMEKKFSKNNLPYTSTDMEKFINEMIQKE